MLQVLVTFSDFETMEKVCSVLLEKLDRSVCVGMPQYYHSAECLSEVRYVCTLLNMSNVLFFCYNLLSATLAMFSRRRACVLAVENAQQKATAVSQLLGQALGPPLLVREEETREWRSTEEDDGRDRPAADLPHLPCVPTVTASSRVSASFSLRDGCRKNL